MSWGLPRSLRARLTGWYALTLACVLGLYALAVFGFLRHQLHQQLDAQLHEDLERAGHWLEPGPDGRPVAGPTVPHDIVEGRWAEVWGVDGACLVRRGSGNGPQLGALEPAGGPAYLPLGDGTATRALAKPYRVGTTGVVVRVARSEAGLHRELRRLGWVLALGLPLGVGLACLVGYGLARRLLAPVGAMADRAQEISAVSLDQRLPVGDPHDELGRLAAVFNDAFGRLERSFDELRQFTADASHELRTPLTAMRTVGEVALREPRDPEAYRDALGSMLEEVDRLSRLTEGLLLLARADAGRLQPQPADLDLDALVRDVCDRLAPLAEVRGARLAVSGGEPIRARADGELLRRALLNLVANAIAHAPAGSAVTVTPGRRADGITVSVRDEGPGIAPEHHARIFERFARLDQDRSRAGGGTGLGLAIAKQAVEVQGGRIELESRPGAGSTFRIALPASDAQTQEIT